ncbi:MAG: histidine ammonia-lyase [Proteobacteria bacterium]|nr:histidine ammonia-lyase [Pseudomonadota bacterium]
MKTEKFHYGSDQMTVAAALAIARGQMKGSLTKRNREKVEKCHQAVSRISAGDKLVYSINTGFGSLCTTKISRENTRQLQENLLKSHSVGVGAPLSTEIAKLMMILKVHSLSMGYSGISLDVINRILWHIDHDYIPLVPEQGSVGASGDLAPLSHLFLPLIGLGKIALKGGGYAPAMEILNEHELHPIKLGPKEGLALINGTQFMAAHAVIVSDRLKKCLGHADLIGALSLEGLLGSVKPFDERLHEIRPHKGAIVVAENLRRYLMHSEFMDYHKDCHRVQDPYSIRCMPQVHGASRDSWSHLHEQLLCELNSVTDNPIIFCDNDAISGGNFHGQPLALPLDYAGLAAAELGNISDRRTYLLLEGKVDLPVYLIENSGVNSGLMIAQYCSAALVSENKSLCFPASADSIPTSLGQEDHVSMGSISGRKTLKIIENLENIQAIELLCATQAIEFRRPKRSSELLESCLKLVREDIPHIKEDVVTHEFIDKAKEIIEQGSLLKLIGEPQI